MRLLRALTIALILGLTAPVAVHAQTPDPDSPAGVEYALPLDRAREDATPGKTKKGAKGKRAPAGQGSPAAAEAAPLFGAGISKGGGGGTGGSRGSGSSSEESGTSKSGESRDGEGSADGGQSRSGTESTDAAKTAAGIDDGGSGLSPTLLGLVAAVLLLGGAAGLGLRRMFGRSQT